VRPLPSSVAMTGTASAALREHLKRPDGQEDICFATYQTSTGARRQTALVRDVVLPLPGEREVHGNASFTGDYVLRAAGIAARGGEGLIILHSHPAGGGWQPLNSGDADAERSYALLVHRVTGLPMVGMTFAGSDGAWSARAWSPEGQAHACESVRVVDSRLTVTWNDGLRPPPRPRETQVRTRSGWGDRMHADVARLRVLVVGSGTVGLDVALRLAATGIQHVAVMDFDTVEIVNIDRLIGVTIADALLHRGKVEVAKRLVESAATAADPQIEVFDMSICTAEGFRRALDFDLIFSCVDRPWPRAVLNMLAYADLIPVVDGGINIDPFPDEGMRNATWRSHVIRPGRPCLACNKQLDLGLVSVDRQGLLDDPTYIAGMRASGRPIRENVAALSVSVTAALLAQFVSLVAGVGGRGEPGPLQYSLSWHTLEHLPYEPGRHCPFEKALARGDTRLDMTGAHPLADEVRAARGVAGRTLRVRIGRAVDDALVRGRRSLTSLLSRQGT
jgi:molybdopterin-synthase adenylyltransferase